MLETQERPPPILNASMADPLGGDARDPRAPTTNLGDIEDGAPRR
jgi:hypothetical protein